MKKHFNKCLLFLACLPLCSSCSNNKQEQLGVIDVANYVDITGKEPCSDKIQSLIINNPHHTLYFRDGIYLLDKQIKTPGDPAKSVDLKLSNYAILKAADNYQCLRSDDEKIEEWQDEYLYMVSLGGLDRENDTTTPGSVYGLTGGIIQGNKNKRIGGIEIAGGRETRVQNVSMKDVEVGLKIARGVNSRSSDADVTDIDIICNESEHSLGMWVAGHDNAITNMRIGHTRHGVLITGVTNVLRNVHPLLDGDNAFEDYESSYGFYVRAQNVLDYCYSDNFATAFKIEGIKDDDLEQKCATRAVFSDCSTWWWNSQGKSYNMIENYGNFNSVFTNLTCGFAAEPDKTNDHYASILKITGGGKTTYESDPTIDGSHGLIENIFINNRSYLGDPDDLYKPTHDETSFFRGVDADF